MNDGIKDVPYAPPAQFKRQRVYNKNAKGMYEFVVLDTFDSEIAPQTRGVGSTTSFDITDVVLKMPINFKNSNNTLVPSSCSALSLSIPDGTLSGGNRRGRGAVDLQILRSSASQVASGDYAFCAGSNNIAAGSNSVALGTGNTVNGSNGVALGSAVSVNGSASFGLGGSLSIDGNYSACFGSNTSVTGSYAFSAGRSNTASSNYSCAFGYYAQANSAGKIAFGAGNNLSIASQSAIQNIYHQTKAVGNVATSLALASTGGVVLQNNSSAGFYMLIVGDVSATASCMFECKGLLRRGANASATSLVGTPTITQLFSDGGLNVCSVALSADTTYGGLQVQITGDTINTINWTVNVYLVEVV